MTASLKSTVFFSITKLASASFNNRFPCAFDVDIADAIWCVFPSRIRFAIAYVRQSPRLSAAG